MQTLTYNATTYFLPENMEEVKQLIREAKQKGQTIAVRGAGHSFPLSTSLEAAANCKQVMLTYLNKITHLDWEKGLVTVQAGCHLGYDSYDPAGVSTEQNSLLYQLDPVNEQGRRTTPPGWTLPDLGGIIHQTIGGFSATGSSGGSVKYAFEDAIVSVRILYHDGNDVVDKTFTRPSDNNPDDPFWGVAYAHLGLMGIMVEMTLQCEPAFNIAGNETVSSLEACAVDLFGNGNKNAKSFETFLRQTDYTRLLWWPQPGVNKAVLWQAGRQDAFTNWSAFQPKPYQEVPEIAGSSSPATAVTDVIFTLLNRIPDAIEKTLLHWFGKVPDERHRLEEELAGADDWLLKAILKVFAADGVQAFQDIGWRGVPMDNAMSDRLFPVWFTELWIPLDRARDVMNSMQQFYQDPLNAGMFCCEFYAGKKSPFWLSPAYGADVIRVDVFWFAKNAGDPTAYFQRFWQQLMPFGFRPHWGKYLPAAGSEQGVSYIKPLYPKWESFMQLREQLDPYGLFLSGYWREHLGIRPSAPPLPAKEGV